MVGSLTVGDYVEFEYITGMKSGKITELVDSFNSIEAKVYCVDPTGGYTITVPVRSIIKKVRTESVTPTTPAKEDIKKPERYNKRGKLECWDVILDQQMDFLEGSVLKYLWRYKEKNGVHDLEKAKVYIDKIILEMKKNETN